MKRLITVLNTTLHLQKLAKPGRPASASSDRALSSVPAARDDNSDVALVRPPAAAPAAGSRQPPPNLLGVTFNKAAPTVISVPPPAQTEDADSGCYGAEPRFQLGAFHFLCTAVVVITNRFNGADNEIGHVRPSDHFHSSF